MYPGMDGRVRVVKVKLKDKVMIRPVNKVFILPVEVTGSGVPKESI